MAENRVICFLLLNLIANVFSVPTALRGKRDSDEDVMNEIKEPEDSMQLRLDDSFPVQETSKSAFADDDDEFDDEDDDDDFDFEPSNTSSTSGSNIFTLFNLLQGLFPASSGNALTKDILRQYLLEYNKKTQNNTRTKRSANIDNIEKKSVITDDDYNKTQNIINIDDIIVPKEQKSMANKDFFKATFPRNHNNKNETAKQNIKESESIEDFESDESDGDDNDSPENSESDESPENDKETPNASQGGTGDTSVSDEDDYDDDFGEGDGQGGGVLGILAGLSGENGESDLGALLATVSGILASLSGGEDFDLNSIIAAGVGLLVGLLSEGEQNPGTVIANYFLTSLDSITGGGSTNNGAFFGSLVSRLVKGISAFRDSEAESVEEGEETKDSSGFVFSLLMSLLGDMSKGSSAGSSSGSSHHCCE